MTKWGKRLFSIAFSFMFLFISIGYAQIADTLTVNGTLNLEEYMGVVITSVEEVTAETKNLNSEGLSYIVPTNLINTVTLTQRNASIKYKITVYNKSPKYKYAYKGLVCDSALDGYNNDLYSQIANNSKFTVSTTKADGSTFAVGTAIEPGETLTFYATYTFGRNVATNTQVKFFLNYNFGVHVDSMGEMAVEKTLGAFAAALNNDEQYSDLITNIDNKYAGQDWQANYIGNVNGSNTEDTETVKRILGEGLTLTIDGVTKNVTVMIKRTNVDDDNSTGDAYKAVQTEWVTNNNGTWWNPNDDYEEEVIKSTTTAQGCEMTIYMTSNDLDRVVEAGEYSDKDYAEVYVAVFTCTNDGVINADGSTNMTSEWYQIGEIYYGYAPIVAYDGTAGGTGSFVTDDWTTIQKTYKVTENYSYTINDGNGRGGNGVEDIREVLGTKDANANNEFYNLRNKANEAIAYIDANKSYFEHAEYVPHVEKLRSVFEKANGIVVNNGTTRADLIQILKELENAIYPFERYIT